MLLGASLGSVSARDLRLPPPHTDLLAGTPVLIFGDGGTPRGAVPAHLLAPHRPAAVQGYQGCGGAKAPRQDFPRPHGAARDARDRGGGGADRAELAAYGLGYADQGAVLLL